MEETNDNVITGVFGKGKVGEQSRLNMAAGPEWVDFTKDGEPDPKSVANVRVVSEAHRRKALAGPVRKSQSYRRAGGEGSVSERPHAAPRSGVKRMNLASSPQRRSCGRPFVDSGRQRAASVRDFLIGSDGTVFHVLSGSSSITPTPRTMPSTSNRQAPAHRHGPSHP